jgi:integrase
MARYGSGSGFWVTRKDGKRVFRVQWEADRTGEGSRRRHTVERATEAEAWRAMRDRQAGVASPPSSSRPRTESTAAFLDRWISDVVTPTRREKTMTGYRAIVRHAKGELGPIDLAKLTTHDVQVYLNGLDLSPQTVRHYAACLRGAFAYAVRRGLLTVNPAAGLDLPRVPRREFAALLPAEVRLLIEHEHPIQPIVIVAVYTGMRLGELLGLKWEDVDLDRGSLVVRRSLSRLPRLNRRGHTRYELTEPKTERSRRTIPLAPRAIEALRAQRLAQLDMLDRRDQGLVFDRPNGSPVDASAVSQAFPRYCRDAGVRVVRFHDLRHTAASLMLMSGVDLKTVSEILGHSTITTTADIYGHLTEQHRRAASERLAEAIG